MNDKQWKPWIEIVKNGERGILKTLTATPVAFRPMVAACLSAAKWHPAKEPRGGGKWTDCGLCQLHEYCSDCPLRGYPPKSKNCARGCFIAWDESKSKRNGDAERVYQRIMDIYRDEYNRYMGIES